MTKKIGFVSGTRADFGLLYRTIKLLQNDSRFDTVVYACGAHLSPEFGMTVSELEKAVIHNVVPVEILLSSGSRVGVSKAVGLATLGFTEVFSRDGLDCLVVLGDRYEILAATQVAMLLDVPIAHIHGGEVTEGAFDDAIRHSITKMSNLHFPATKSFAKRIMQLGESEERIFTIGAPGIDNIVNEPRLDKGELESSLGFALGKKVALVTYHPVTKTVDNLENDITPLVEAVKAFPDMDFVITYPNADGDGALIISQWQSIAALPNIHLVTSLGFVRYLSLMEHVDCVIGNSSSGIIETPSFNVGTINIGSRQKGRPRAVSVIDIEMNKNDIVSAINLCCSEAFRIKHANTVNPYGEGRAAENILNVLASTDFETIKMKRFIDRI